MNTTADAPRSEDTESPPFEALEPWDEHNRKLAANVHPLDWSNPTPADRYHLVVVGAGTAGLVTAAIAVALGARVALVERKLMGGDCLNVGCVPSKAVLAAARAWRSAVGAGRLAGPAAAGEGDFGAVMERMRRLRSEISEHDSAARFSTLGADVFFGQASFIGSDTIRVGDSALRFRRAVIATGTTAAVPPIEGLVEAGYLTNETVFSLTALPPRLAVIGGGAIGCELAQAFAAFGSRVTVLEGEARILGADDPDAAALVARSLQNDGVDIVTGAKVRSVTRTHATRTLRWEAGGERHELECDEVLVGVGRSPNVEGLGLETVGVRSDGREGVEVDDRLQTSNSSIYAIGDVAGPARFTHVADAHARLVVRNALFYGRGKVSDLVIPWCTYTSPELAHVGLRHDEVVERGADVDSITVPFSSVDRAILDGEEEGFLRVHLARGSDRILGATIVGEEAGELISQITQAMVAGVGLGKLSATIFPYPTRAEIIRKAADAWGRQRLTPTARKVFGLFFRATA
ncbi:MAG: mercuric reductase [Gemmatimonadota bacterium]